MVSFQEFTILGNIFSFGNFKVKLLLWGVICRSCWLKVEEKNVKFAFQKPVFFTHLCMFSLPFSVSQYSLTQRHSHACKWLESSLRCTLEKMGILLWKVARHSDSISSKIPSWLALKKVNLQTWPSTTSTKAIPSPSCDNSKNSLKASQLISFELVD